MISSITERLFALSDSPYADFQAKLTPGIARELFIGVRVPQLRTLAKALTSEERAAFIAELPHKYYDENILHSVLLSSYKDFDALIAELDRFLPYVDNWAVCDIISPKLFKKHTAELMPHILRWLKSGECYTVRFAIEMLMSFYLEDCFELSHLDLVADIKTEEYYLRMMQAWYFATALAKQYDKTLPYIEQRRLEPWTHNKAIQKSIESRRISDEQKSYLRSLKL